MQYFPDRRQAGQSLAAHLLRYAGQRDLIVLALPRGGVPVAYEVALALHAPLDIVVVRKLGVPGHAELAMGAIAGGKVCVLNRELLRDLRIENAEIDHAVTVEREELRRRERVYRGERPSPHVAGKTVILVDDGLATGATMSAAVAAVERQHAADVVVAAPVASREAVAQMRASGLTVVVVLTPEPFHGVSLWYDDFEQTTDAEVRSLLDAAWQREAAAATASTAVAAPPPVAPVEPRDDLAELR